MWTPNSPRRSTDPNQSKPSMSLESRKKKAKTYMGILATIVFVSWVQPFVAVHLFRAQHDINPYSTKAKSSQALGCPSGLCAARPTFNLCEYKQQRTRRWVDQFGVWPGYGNPMRRGCRALFNLNLSHKEVPVYWLDCSWKCRIMLHQGMGMTLWAQQSEVPLQVRVVRVVRVAFGCFRPY